MIEIRVDSCSANLPSAGKRLWTAGRMGVRVVTSNVEVLAVKYGFMMTRRSEGFYRYDAYGEEGADLPMDLSFRTSGTPFTSPTLQLVPR